MGLRPAPAFFCRRRTLSNSSGGAAEGVRRKIASAYDLPETEEEVTRRTFMANATLAIGGVVGLVLAVPILGSLVPEGSTSAGSWAPLSSTEMDALAKAT